MTKSLELRGILPAMITPFTEDGAKIDVDGLIQHTEFLLDAGCGGLIPGGSTGEFTSLTQSEREVLHATVTEAAQGRAPVIPQTGAMTAQEAIELSLHAQSVGAAAVMVAPPYYETLTFDEMHTFYRSVADAIDIPVMLYNIPGATGQHLSTDQVGRLAEIPGIFAIKDSGADASALTALLETYGDRLQVCNGWDSLTFFGFAAGAKASVWGAANVFPELAVGLYDALAIRGDLADGRRIWSQLYPLVHFLEDRCYAARVKAACRLLGRPAGPSRLPLLAPSHEDAAVLAGLLRGIGLTVDDARLDAEA
jgi:4-hydroxy-tetrahydrodipicolinate synthase